MHARNNPKKHYYFTYLSLAILLCLFYLVSSYNYHLLAQPRLHLKDTARHLRNVYLMHNRFTEAGWMAPFLSNSTGYPPLTYYVTLAAFSIFGKTITAAIFSQAVFWLILTLAVFGICKRIANPEIAFVGVMITLSIPGLNVSTGRYMLDLPVVAMTALAFLCLLKSGSFKNGAWSYAFFVSCALALLTKRLFPLFIAPAFIITTADVLKEVYRRDEAGWKNAAVLLLPFAAAFVSLRIFNHFDTSGSSLNSLPGLWPRIIFYLISLLPMAASLFALARLSGIDAGIRRIASGLLITSILVWHVYGMNFQHLWKTAALYSQSAKPIQNAGQFVVGFLAPAYGIPLLIYTTIGIVFYAVMALQKKNIRRADIVFWSLIVTCAALFLISRTDVRYPLPTLVFAAPLSVYWMNRVKNRHARVLMIFAVLYLSLAGFYGWAFKGASTYFIPLKKIENQRLFIRPNPPEKGYATKDLADTVHLLSKDKKPFLIIVSGHSIPAAEMIKGLHVTLLYQHHRHFQHTFRFGSVTLNEEGRPKASNQNRYIYVFHSQRPDLTAPERYDCIIGVQFQDEKNMETVSNGLRRVCRTNGISPIPDAAINHGRLPGFERERVSATVVRIPLKSSPESVKDGTGKRRIHNKTKLNNY